LEDAAAILFDALCTGITDAEAMDDLGVDRETYDAVKKKMFDVRAEEIRSMPTEHVFVQYILDQTANVRDLTAMIGEFRATKQYNAMVGAIRTRSDIQDKLITRGQEFGFIRKTPDRKQIVAGIVITDMTNEQLKRAALRELREFKTMMEDAGDVDFLDVEAGEVHRGPALPPAPEPIRTEPGTATKTNRSKAGGKNSSKARGRKKQRM
jgi:hypothetical protein